jgi:hypothetical protein
VVLNRPGPGDDSPLSARLALDNREIIASLSGVPVWEALPHVPGAGALPGPTRELAEHLFRAGAGALIRGL